MYSVMKVEQLLPEGKTSEEQKQKWETAKVDTLKQIKQLPSYDAATILRTYSELLIELQREEVASLPEELRAFTMQKKYPQFALAYSGLFNKACRRTAIPVHVVKEMLDTVARKNEGVISEAKGRGIIMDIAEGYRRGARDLLKNAGENR